MTSVGGMNVIPEGNASNPTLTAMYFAIRGVENIIEGLAGKK